MSSLHPPLYLIINRDDKDEAREAKVISDTERRTEGYSSRSF